MIDKRNPYEEDVRIPLLVHPPTAGRLFSRQPAGAKTGRGQLRVEDLVLAIDVAPTVLELAGLPSPGSMDGRSWVPLLQAKLGVGPSITEHFESSRGPRWRCYGGKMPSLNTGASPSGPGRRPKRLPIPSCDGPRLYGLQNSPRCEICRARVEKFASTASQPATGFVCPPTLRRLVSHSLYGDPTQLDVPSPP